MDLEPALALGHQLGQHSVETIELVGLPAQRVVEVVDGSLAERGGDLQLGDSLLEGLDPRLGVSHRPSIARAIEVEGRFRQLARSGCVPWVMTGENASQHGHPRRAYVRGMTRPAPTRPMMLRVLVIAASLGLFGCAAGDVQFTADDPAGFWAGLWHGMISLVTLVVGLFSDDVGFWELDNLGWRYEAGFWLGLVIMAGGGHRGASYPSRRARDREWDRDRSRGQHPRSPQREQA